MQLFFKLVVQVAVFFNGVSKEKCVQIFVPCKVALFQQECSQVFERVTSCNRITANFVSNLWCKLPCFCNCVSKEKCVQIFLPCNVALFLQDGSQVFLNVFTSCNRITANVFQNCGASCRVFATAIQKKSACKFLCPATLHFSCKTAHKFFERACFQQPYYDKRCCEICYLLPKIGNFTKKIAKKYLKPLTVFGD